jgi:DNA ligase-1
MSDENLPCLYKRSKTGATLFWRVHVEAEPRHAVVTEYGVVGGATQVARVEVGGKNKGRKSETTDAEQAVKEARQLWRKRVERQGYSTDAEAKPRFSPMLAQVYRAAATQWPQYVQPKLDGHRATYDGGLWSRTGVRIAGLGDLETEIQALLGEKSLVLDGELYNHDMRADFEALTSAIRGSAEDRGQGAVEYHVYDCYVPGLDFEARMKVLDQVFGGLSRRGRVVRVETVAAASEAEMWDRFRDFRDSGYEGAMLRAPRGLYVCQRSRDLQKVKEFQDAEFEVVAVKEGRGRAKGSAILTCVTADGLRFDCVLKADLETRRQVFRDRESYVGARLTVGFQKLSKRGVPVFPVGLRFRKDL